MSKTAQKNAMKFQVMLGNGRWVDEERIDYFVSLAVARDAFFAKRENRVQMTSDDVMTALAAGKQLSYDTDWYANLRDADNLKRLAGLEVEEVKCDCGHYTAHAMNTSRGTSCPYCYDEMSE